jgi:hypothetical protein
MSNRKRDPDDMPERVFCYLCDKVILKFNSPDEERVFSKTGLCSRCQKQLRKGIEKDAI